MKRSQPGINNEMVVSIGQHGVMQQQNGGEASAKAINQRRKWHQWQRNNGVMAYHRNQWQWRWQWRLNQPSAGYSYQPAAA
jgi:hypothetical protein